MPSGSHSGSHGGGGGSHFGGGSSSGGSSGGGRRYGRSYGGHRTVIFFGRGGVSSVFAALAVFALAIGLYILANIGEYIICWLLSKDEDDDE